MSDTARRLARAGSAFSLDLDPTTATPVSGGSINRALRFQCVDNRPPVFAKINTADRCDMFEAECAGLEALSDANAVRVPQAYGCGKDGEISFLFLEWLDLGASSARADARLGEALAAQHRCTRDDFGWTRDNTIGSTPQANAPMAEWPEFYAARRLGFQLELAQKNGFSNRLLENGQALADTLPFFFTNYKPTPSLLHGDLWGGNYGALISDEPVIFDPAVYYGDREADLAMTELFGGFSRTFYDAYAAAWPLDPGYASRKTLYNLYHVLNHANLFGGGYASQAESMIGQLLAELG